MVKTLSKGSGLAVCAGSLWLAGCTVREVRYQSPPPPPPPAVGVGVGVGVGADVSVGGELEVGVAPPAPLVDVRVASPGVDFVWIPGAYVWNGRWVWEGGRWDHPPRRGAVWVPHHYVYRGGRHVFVRGGWR